MNEREIWLNEAASEDGFFSAFKQRMDGVGIPQWEQQRSHFITLLAAIVIAPVMGLMSGVISPRAVLSLPAPVAS